MTIKIIIPDTDFIVQAWFDGSAEVQTDTFLARSNDPVHDAVAESLADAQGQNLSDT